MPPGEGSQGWRVEAAVGKPNSRNIIYDCEAYVAGHNGRENGMHYYLQCVHCGKAYCHSENVYQCQECGHKLQVVYRSLPEGDNVAV